jgi:hypothetical protein
MNRNVMGLLKTLASLVIGIGSGTLIPGMHFLIRGHSDPINSDLPYYLPITSFVSTAVIVYQLRCPVMTASGVFGGLVLALFASGGSEYPYSSLIALAVHGFVPALAGGLVVYVVCCSSAGQNE